MIHGGRVKPSLGVLLGALGFLGHPADALAQGSASGASAGGRVTSSASGACSASGASASCTGRLAFPS